MAALCKVIQKFKIAKFIKEMFFKICTWICKHHGVQSQAFGRDHRRHCPTKTEICVKIDF